LRATTTAVVTVAANSRRKEKKWKRDHRERKMKKRKKRKEKTKNHRCTQSRGGAMVALFSGHVPKQEAARAARE
jgi:hypothetical protein